MAVADEHLQAHLDSFERRGVAVVPTALSADEVSALRRAIDDDRAAHPEHWQQKAGRKAAGARTFEGHHFQSTKVLLTGKGFDHTCS
jgi:hypothetical protein